MSLSSATQSSAAPNLATWRRICRLFRRPPSTATAQLLPRINHQDESIFDQSDLERIDARLAEERAAAAARLAAGALPIDPVIDTPGQQRQ